MIMLDRRWICPIHAMTVGDLRKDRALSCMTWA
jgi:hypothetical protein